MRFRCRIGVHDYERITDSHLDRCVWCEQVFYTGSDHGALNISKEAAQARRYAERTDVKLARAGRRTPLQDLRVARKR